MRSGLPFLGLSFLCLVGWAVHPQTARKSPSPKPGVVSGSVFAITEGGDLKPARLAHVYLLYIYRSVAVANANPEDQNSAGMAWLDNQLKTQEAFNKLLETEGINWSDSLTCQKNLEVYTSALLQTVNWAQTIHKEWQVISVDADEYGKFEVAVPRPGNYRVLASGRAGAYDAFWEFDHNVAVNPGEVTTVKLSSPKPSCLNIK